jgi:hypothetical protein
MYKARCLSSLDISTTNSPHCLNRVEFELALRPGNTLSSALFHRRDYLAFLRNTMTPSGQSPLFRILARKRLRILLRNSLQEPEIPIVFVDIALQTLPSLCKVAELVRYPDLPDGAQDLIQHQASVETIEPGLVLLYDRPFRPHESFDDQVPRSL